MHKNKPKTETGDLLKGDVDLTDQLTLYDCIYKENNAMQFLIDFCILRVSNVFLYLPCVSQILKYEIFSQPSAWRRKIYCSNKFEHFRGPFKLNCFRGFFV